MSKQATYIYIYTHTHTHTHTHTPPHTYSFVKYLVIPINVRIYSEDIIYVHIYLNIFSFMSYLKIFYLFIRLFLILC